VAAPTLRKAPDSMVQRAHVIDDFSRVLQSLAFRRLLAFFKAKDLIECRLDAFDLGTPERLLAHVHRDEQIRVGQKRRDAGERSQALIGAGEQTDGLGVEAQRWLGREGGRNVSQITGGLWNRLPCSRAHRFHSFNKYA